MYQIEVKTSGGLRVDATDGGSSAVMDEPQDLGGTNAGLSPLRTLIASLAACSAMTAKLYSERKGWPLEDVRIVIRYDPPPRGEAEAPHHFVQEIELVGDLDAEQRERILAIAGRCPVHKVLEGPCTFEELLVAAAGA